MAAPAGENRDARRREARAKQAAPPSDRGRWPFWAALVALEATLIVTPLLFDPTSRDSFRLPKAMFVQLAVLVSLAMMSLAWALRGREGGERSWPWREWLRAPALKAIGPFVLAATVLSLASSHREHVLRALVGLWIGGLAVWGWSLGFKRVELSRLLALVLMPACLLALVAIFQFHDIFQPFRFESLRRGSRLAITSLAGNAGDLASFLVLPALVAQRSLAARGWRLWPALALLLSFYGIAVTQTFAAVAALAAGSAVLWWPLLRGRWRVLAAAAPAVALLLALAMSTPFQARALGKAKQVASGDWNAVLTGRLDGWRAGLQMFHDHPVKGVGLGAYRAEFVRAKRALLQQGVKFFPEQANVVFANAHSEPIEVAAELGLVGLLFAGWAVSEIVRQLAKLPGAEISREAGADRAFARGALVALAALALVSFPFRIAIVSSQVLVLLAWIFARPEPAE